MESNGDHQTSMRVSLPETLRRFVDERVAGGFDSPSEYIRDLIQQDRERAAGEQLQNKLIEGLESGEPIEVTPDFWERKRRELRERNPQ